ncbi:MAG: PF20097 family protein [Thermoplasmata archaeon]
MTEQKCPVCHAPLEQGFVSTSNGSGLYWSHDHPSSRLRPNGLEVLAPTGFMGTFSANLPAQFCRSCGRIELQLAAPTK